jgi:hypothetical protein
MAVARPAAAPDPRCFGRRPVSNREAEFLASFPRRDDLRLFAITFVAGFLFVSILIG